MWEERFSATSDYVFGKAPSQFMTTHAGRFTTGQTVLSVADGEGRNSVYLASNGLSVTALEFAPSAVEKARALASEAGTTVDFRVCDVVAEDWEQGFSDGFDIVLAVFIQFSGPADRARLFQRMQDATRPGGLIMLHGYTPKQLEYGTGGPPMVENLYTPEILADHFPGWEIEENRTYELELEEGKGHSGRSAVIDFIARKPG